MNFSKNISEVISYVLDFDYITLLMKNIEETSNTNYIFSDIYTVSIKIIYTFYQLQ